eukprot:1808119-Pleurochrysis_carterae.AAC.1
MSRSAAATADASSVPVVSIAAASAQPSANIAAAWNVASSPNRSRYSSANHAEVLFENSPMPSNDLCQTTASSTYSASHGGKSPTLSARASSGDTEK